MRFLWARARPDGSRETGQVEDELESLRRRAYSRGGTADDRQRLARAEREAPAPTPTPGPTPDPPPAAAAALVAERVDAVSDGAPPPADDPRPPRAASRRAALLGAAGGAAATLLVVALAGAVGAGRITHLPDSASPAPRDPLAIFDVAGTPDDDIPGVDPASLSAGGLRDAATRFLATTPQGTVYAVRGTTAEGPSVCLALAFPTGVRTTCTALADFERDGIVYVDGQLTARWGPIDPVLWLPAD